MAVGDVFTNFAWYEGMILALTNTSSGLLTFTSANNRIEIYSGTMPTDADDWVPGGGGSPVTLLATFDDFLIIQNTQVNYIISVQQAVFKADKAPNPGTLNATATGQAAWYAMFQPAQYTTKGVLLGDVSPSGENGTLHLDDINLVAGQPVQLLHWGLEFTTP